MAGALQFWGASSDLWVDMEEALLSTVDTVKQEVSIHMALVSPSRGSKIIAPFSVASAR